MCKQSLKARQKSVNYELHEGERQNQQTSIKTCYICEISEVNEYLMMYKAANIHIEITKPGCMPSVISYNNCEHKGGVCVSLFVFGVVLWECSADSGVWTQQLHAEGCSYLS